jgi:hypothetical protein
MSAPTTMSQYIDALCQHLADFQDRIEASNAFNVTTDAQLHVRLSLNGEVVGMRRALALALGLDPDQESDKEEAADSYHMEWRERNGR